MPTSVREARRNAWDRIGAAMATSSPACGLEVATSEDDQVVAVDDLPLVVRPELTGQLAGGATEEAR